MDNSTWATKSLDVVGSESNSVRSRLMPGDDQYFLLYFIMGTFFGPDLKGERPQKSILQRHAEGLPLYTPDQLAGSHIKIAEIERVYYHVLRKANQSVVLKQPQLQEFFHGNLPLPAQHCTATYPQFPYLFPPQLHPQSRLKNRCRIIGNILFINNPQIFYFKPEDFERFKQLTKLEEFPIDITSARLHICVNGVGLYNVAMREVESNGNLPLPRPSHSFQRTGNFPLPSPSHSFQRTENLSLPRPSCSFKGTEFFNDFLGHSENFVNPPMTHTAQLTAETETSFVEMFEPGMVFLPSPPTREEWKNIVTVAGRGSALTGTAATGNIGPVIGLVDIGECEDSYLFRVSLPGVKRDERDFGCEVESDGKVLIRGVTTMGDKTVYRHSQVFEMQTQNLCPQGHFSISFKLPGPVDPQQFSGTFGTDGILEGTVMKWIPRGK